MNSTLARSARGRGFRAMADFELQYPHILTAVLGRPWAILPEKAAVIAELLAARAAGRRFTTEEIAARIIDPLAARREAAGRSLC